MYILLSDFTPKNKAGRPLAQGPRRQKSTCPLQSAKGSWLFQLRYSENLSEIPEINGMNPPEQKTCTLTCYSYVLLCNYDNIKLKHGLYNNI